MSYSCHRVVFATFGSLGDLHPYLALAIEMKRRGHQPLVATVEMFRELVESEGIEFRLLRSALIDRPDGELMRKVLDLRHGPEFIIRQLMMPALRTALADALCALEGASLLVSHPLAFAARLAAENANIPWVSTQLAPIGYLSSFDPPAIPIAPFLNRLRWLGPAFFRPLILLAKLSVRQWTTPYIKLRAELHLPPAPDPMFDGGHAPGLELALFSRLLGDRQPDWPSQAEITGFAFYDGTAPELPLKLENFLRDGDAPAVFTLGTSAVLDAGKFYECSAAAATALGLRAVLLVGNDPENVPTILPPDVIAVPYARFSLLFPRASVIIHHGGVGTTAQAMRAGKPEIVVPYAVDQPDNALRLEKLGVARVLPKKRISTNSMSAALREVITQPSFAHRAESIRQQLEAEDGIGIACDLLERRLLA